MKPPKLCNDWTMQDEEENQLTGLEIVGDLMRSHASLFSDQLVQLGIFERIHTIAGDDCGDEDIIMDNDATIAEATTTTVVATTSVTSSLTSTSNAATINTLSDPSGHTSKQATSSSPSHKDAREVLMYRPYIWKEWCIIRGASFFFIFLMFFFCSLLRVFFFYLIFFLLN